MGASDPGEEIERGASRQQSLFLRHGFIHENMHSHKVAPRGRSVAFASARAAS